MKLKLSILLTVSIAFSATASAYPHCTNADECFGKAIKIMENVSNKEDVRSACYLLQDACEQGNDAACSKFHHSMCRILPDDDPFTAPSEILLKKCLNSDESACHTHDSLYE